MFHGGVCFFKDKRTVKTEHVVVPEVVWRDGGNETNDASGVPDEVAEIGVCIWNLDDGEWKLAKKKVSKDEWGV